MWGWCACWCIHTIGGTDTTGRTRHDRERGEGEKDTGHPTQRMRHAHLTFPIDVGGMHVSIAVSLMAALPCASQNCMHTHMYLAHMHARMCCVVAVSFMNVVLASQTFGSRFVISVLWCCVLLSRICLLLLRCCGAAVSPYVTPHTHTCHATPSLASQAGPSGHIHHTPRSTHMHMHSSSTDTRRTANGAAHWCNDIT